MQKLSNNYRFTQRYSVKYIIPDGKVLKRQPTTTVDVTLSGMGWDLVTKSSRSIGDKIEVELSKDNNQLIPAIAITEKINSLLVTDAISVARIVPNMIEIFLEDQAQKKVPVVSKLNMDYMPGYYIKKEMKFTPDSIIVTGAAQILRDISEWNTEVLNINKLNKNILDMPISLESPSQDILRLSHREVKMNLEVEEFTEKEFVLPLNIKNSDNKVKTLPDKVTVKCVVGLSKYDILNEGDIEMYINLDESLVNADDNTAPISISRMPGFVRHIEYEPKAAKFFIVR